MTKHNIPEMSVNATNAQLHAEVERRIRVEHETSSLRELADRLGVSYNAVWRLLKGHQLRPSTIRRMRNALDQETAVEEDPGEALKGFVRRALPNFEERRILQISEGMARAIEEVCEEAAVKVPAWVKRLRKEHP